MKLIKNIQKLLGPWVGSTVFLFMRLFWGYQFMQHGWVKLQNIEGTAAMFSSLNILWPTASAWLVGLVEGLGGIALLLGAFSSLSSLLLSITMIVAYFTAHMEGVSAIFTTPQLFVDQSPFMYLLTSLLVFAFGPGKFSVDSILFQE